MLGLGIGYFHQSSEMKHDEAYSCAKKLFASAQIKQTP